MVGEKDQHTGRLTIADALEELTERVRIEPGSACEASSQFISLGLVRAAVGEHVALRSDRSSQGSQCRCVLSQRDVGYFREPELVHHLPRGMSSDDVPGLVSEHTSKLRFVVSRENKTGIDVK